MKSLFEHKMADKNFRKQFEKEYPIFKLEVQILNALERKGWTYSRFAKALGTQKSNVSRDLKTGSIQRATIARVTKMAHALDYDFVPVFIPLKNEPQILSEIQKLLAVAT